MALSNFFNWLWWHYWHFEFEIFFPAKFGSDQTAAKWCRWIGCGAPPVRRAARASPAPILIWIIPTTFAVLTVAPTLRCATWRKLPARKFRPECFRLISLNLTRSFLSKCHRHGYRSIAFWTLYKTSFRSDTIHQSVRLQIRKIRKMN